MEPGSILVALNAQEGTVPEEIQLLPPGPDIEGLDGRRWKLPDAQRVVDATNALRIAKAIDENHSIYRKGVHGDPSPAVGWFDRVYLKGSETWAHVSWTPRGRELVENQSYRFISPVFKHDKKTGEILWIAGAGLTNTPNLVDISALNDQEEDLMKVPAIILATLGLAQDVDENEVVTAINSLKSAGGTATGTPVDLTAYAPRADYNLMEQRAINAEAQLEELKKDDIFRRAEGAVDAAINARKIAPASRDAYLAMCSSEDGLAQFAEIVKTSPEIIPSGDDPSAGGAPPATSTALNAEEQEVARQLGLPETDEK